MAEGFEPVAPARSADLTEGREGRKDGVTLNPRSERGQDSHDLQDSNFKEQRAATASVRSTTVVVFLRGSRFPFRQADQKLAFAQFGIGY
jgi:hypothetical protein